VKSAEQIKGGIRFKEPKSGHARTVSLSSIVIAELKAHRARQAEEQLRLGIRPDADSFVVAQYDGSPIQSRSLTHEWVRILAKTALPRIRLHDLRHSHVSQMLAGTRRSGLSLIFTATSCRECRRTSSKLTPRSAVP